VDGCSQIIRGTGGGDAVVDGDEDGGGFDACGGLRELLAVADGGVFFDALFAVSGG